MSEWHSGYAPFRYQADLHRARWSHPFRWLSAGVGTGKTTWGVNEALLFTQVFAPRSNGLIVVPDYGTFHDVVLPEVERWWPPIWDTGAPGGRPELRVRTPEGVVTIFVRSGNNRRNVRAINGLTVGWAYFEEPGRIHEGADAWMYTGERLRGSTVEWNGHRLHGPVWMSGTPWPGWLPEAFGVQDTGHPDVAWERGYSPKDGMFVRCARTEDNTKLAPEFSERLRARMSQELAAQELDGQVVPSRGRILHNFYRGLHVIPAAKAMELFNASEPSRRHGGADFGVTDPAALSWGAWVHDSRAVMAGEWKHAGTTEEEQGYEAWLLSQRRGVQTWWLPHDRPGVTGKWRNGFIRPEDGRRYTVPGVRSADTSAGSRGASFSTIRNLLAIRKDGQPGMFISDACAGWIEEAEKLRTPDNSTGPAARDGAVAPGLDDHVIDASRMWLYSSSTTARAGLGMMRH